MKLPKNFKKLEKLEEVNLSYNHFISLPDDLNSMPFLKKLEIEGTNISDEELQKIKKSLPKTEVIF